MFYTVANKDPTLGNWDVWTYSLIISSLRLPLATEDLTSSIMDSWPEELTNYRLYRPIWPWSHAIMQFFISWRSVTKSRMFLTLIWKNKQVRSAIWFILSSLLLSSPRGTKKAVGYKGIYLLSSFWSPPNFSLLNRILSEPMALLVLVCLYLQILHLKAGMCNKFCLFLNSSWVFAIWNIFHHDSLYYRLIVLLYLIFIWFTFGVAIAHERWLICHSERKINW